jgi:hypothetical protein
VVRVREVVTSGVGGALDIQETGGAKGSYPPSAHEVVASSSPPVIVLQMRGVISRGYLRLVSVNKGGGGGDVVVIVSVSRLRMGEDEVRVIVVDVGATSVSRLQTREDEDEPPQIMEWNGGTSRTTHLII